MYFRLGADIDSLRRFVEDQNLRIDRQPSCQRYFLLIATRQRAGFSVDRRCFDSQLLDITMGELSFLCCDRSTRNAKQSLNWRDWC